MQSWRIHAQLIPPRLFFISGIRFIPLSFIWLTRSCENIKTVMWLLWPLYPYLLPPPPAGLLDALVVIWWLSSTLSSMRTKGNTKPEEAIGQKKLHSEYKLLLVIVLCQKSSYVVSEELFVLKFCQKYIIGYLQSVTYRYYVKSTGNFSIYCKKTAWSVLTN